MRSDYEILGVWDPLRITRAGDMLHISQGYLATLGRNALAMSGDYLTSQGFLADLRNEMSDDIVKVEDARAESTPGTLIENLTSWLGYDNDIWGLLDHNDPEWSV